jgi:hemerythrin-like domain-containing protein
VPKATDQLIKDHKMIRQILTDFSLENPRFPQLLKTLRRVVVGHAWFEDAVFLPAFAAEPLLHRRFMDEITQEHKDLDALLSLLRETPLSEKSVLDSYLLQMRSVLETHLKKEEDALFPMAEKILNEEGLNRLGDEMERRKTEVRDLVKE